MVERRVDGQLHASSMLALIYLAHIYTSIVVEAREVPARLCVIGMVGLMAGGLFRPSATFGQDNLHAPRRGRDDRERSHAMSSGPWRGMQMAMHATSPVLGVMTDTMTDAMTDAMLESETLPDRMSRRSYRGPS